MSFIAGARSLSKEDLRKSLQVFNVAQAGVDTLFCDSKKNLSRQPSRLRFNRLSFQSLLD